jgi:hypothetical protein
VANDNAYRGQLLILVETYGFLPYPHIFQVCLQLWHILMHETDVLEPPQKALE